MKLRSKPVLWLAGHDEEHACALARHARDVERAELDRERNADEIRFRESMDRVRRVPSVVVGTTDTGSEYRIAIPTLMAAPFHVSGGTGSGKSRILGAIMEGVLAAIVRGEPCSIVLFDGKGEAADALARSVARLAMALPEAARRSFLSRVFNFSFFGSRFLPSWPLLARVSGVAIDIQAAAIADVLIAVVGDGSMGARQRATLAAILAIAIEFQIPLAALPWLLARPEEVAALASRSSLPLVRLELERFHRESPGSVDGIRARIATLLRPSLKAVFSGTRPFDFTACLAPGAVSLFSYGSSELGDTEAVRVAAALSVTVLANAVFDPRRQVRGSTLLVIDELPAIASAVVLAEIERLGSRGRSFGAGATGVCHQGASQLSPEFRDVLATNTALRLVGRSAERDVRLAAEFLPKAIRVPRPRDGSRGTPFLSLAEEERFWVDQIGRLQQRRFLVADRRADFQPRIVTAPAYAPPPWSAIPADVAEAVERGANGVPRAELEARVRDVEARAAAEMAAEPVQERGGSRRRATETPHVVGSRRRSRRGGP